jgi:hypothetical protein
VGVLDLFATESKETGGAIAGCARNHATIRLYSSKKQTTPAPSPSALSAFHARPAGGGFITCGSAGETQLICQGGPEGTNALENVATLRSDGQFEACSRQRTGKGFLITSANVTVVGG